MHPHKAKIFGKMNIFDNRYEQETLLGKGAFSEVWKVRDIQTGVSLALKIYNSANGASVDGSEMLTHEFALMVNVNHKNLLRPLFYATCENRPYLILPYCESGNIGKMVGKMTEDEAWRLFRDCASALSYLHALHPPILHQDIKPANILIGDNGEYMLTDFGVSTQLKASLSRVSNQELALFSAGTVSYMAPERFSRNNLPIMANDIYSLGSTVYEMLSGFLPFGNDGGLLQKKGAEIPELQGDFSPMLKKTLDLCLQAEPWDRPTAEDLEDIANKALTHRELRWKEEEKPVPQQNEESASETIAEQPTPIKEAPVDVPPVALHEIEDTIGEEHAPSRKKLYGIIGVIAAVALLIGGFFFWKSGIQENSQQEVINADSLKRIVDDVEYEKCLVLFQQPDSTREAFNKTVALAQKGHKGAVHEVAYTYAWVARDPESIRRKKALGWGVGANGLPVSEEINRQAVVWLDKSIQLTDSTDYQALYWRSFYYINEILGERDFEKASQLLSKSSLEASKNQDYVFKNKIDDTIHQLEKIK